MSLIAQALADNPIEGEQPGRPCAGARYHSPTPLLVSEVLIDGKVVLLCGTCRDNLRVFGHLMTTSNGTLPWAVRRQFGNLLRALGMRAWEHRGNSG